MKNDDHKLLYILVRVGCGLSSWFGLRFTGLPVCSASRHVLMNRESVWLTGYPNRAGVYRAILHATLRICKSRENYDGWSHHPPEAAMSRRHQRGGLRHAYGVSGPLTRSP